MGSGTPAASVPAGRSPADARARDSARAPLRGSVFASPLAEQDRPVRCCRRGGPAGGAASRTNPSRDRGTCGSEGRTQARYRRSTRPRRRSRPPPRSSRPNAEAPVEERPCSTSRRTRPAAGPPGAGRESRSEIADPSPGRAGGERPRTADDRTGELGERLCESRAPAGCRNGVRVDEHDDVSRCCVPPAIARCSGVAPAVRPHHVRTEAPRDGARAVYGAVVDDDDLGRWRLLGCAAPPVPFRSSVRRCRQGLRR